MHIGFFVLSLLIIVYFLFFFFCISFLMLPFLVNKRCIY